jgi:acetyl esterase/lipase
MSLELVTKVFGLLGPGRSPATMLNLLAPRRGYKLHRGLTYGEGARDRYDVYVPTTLTKPAPVILFFYGGGFVAGHRNEYRMVGEALASLGCVVAIADYRIFPQGRFPEFLHDGARALHAVYREAKSYGGDQGRLFVAGHSAGAYIAVMLAANPEYLKAAGADPSWISGAIGIAGAYDFLPITGERRIKVFGGGNRVESQPIHFVHGKKPPMLLVTGANDSTVSTRNTKNMAARLRSVGSEVEEIIYPGVGHMGIILSLARGFRGRAPLRTDIAKFIAAH